MDLKKMKNAFKRRSVQLTPSQSERDEMKGAVNYYDSIIMEGESESISSEVNGDEKRLVNTLHKYYGNANTDSLCTDSSDFISKYQQMNPQNKVKDTVKQLEGKKAETGISLGSEKVECKICNNKSGRMDNYMILSCNHVFHVYCLAETHFSDIYKFNVIDDGYFATRKCLVCNTNLQTEELMFLHSKFLSGTKGRIEEHNESITQLEKKLQHLKDELKVCYDYRHKLEQEREKSKQIVATLMTMM